jgi:hypothetical protein
LPGLASGSGKAAILVDVRPYNFGARERGLALEYYLTLGRACMAGTRSAWDYLEDADEKRVEETEARGSLRDWDNMVVSESFGPSRK